MGGGTNGAEDWTIDGAGYGTTIDGADGAECGHSVDADGSSSSLIEPLNRQQTEDIITITDFIDSQCISMNMVSIQVI